MPYLSLHSDIARVSVVLGVAIQLSNLLRNDRVSTGKTFKRDFGVFFNVQNAINAAQRLTLRHVFMESLELNFLWDNIAFVLNNTYK